MEHKLNLNQQDSIAAQKTESNLGCINMEVMESDSSTLLALINTQQEHGILLEKCISRQIWINWK